MISINTSGTLSLVTMGISLLFFILAILFTLSFIQHL